jgi:hypothetical protein
VTALLEETHILNGDHGLIGKRLKQRDLFRRERAYLHTPNHDDSDRIPFAQQGGRQYCSRAEALLVGCGVGKRRLNLHRQIVNVNRLPFQHGSADDHAILDWYLLDSRTRPMRRRQSKEIAFDTVDVSVLGFT